LNEFPADGDFLFLWHDGLWTSLINPNVFINMLLRPATSNNICKIMDIVAEVVPLVITSGNLQWSSNYPNSQVFEKDISNRHLWVAEINGQLARSIPRTGRMRWQK